MITIGEYKQAEKELKKIQEEKDKQYEIFEKDYSILSEKYFNLERKLDEKKQKEQNAYETKKEKFKTEIKNRETPYVQKIQEYKQVLAFMEIHKEKSEVKLASVYHYDYPRDEKGEVIRKLEGNCLCYPDKIEIAYEPLAIIKNNKYAVINAYITQNDKPKNKYTLCIVGNTIFKELLEDRHIYSYRYDYQMENANINIWLADKPTKEELISFFERYKKNKNFLKDFLVRHEQIEQEYETIITATNNNMWELAYWENKKDYYENHYNRGMEQPEYQDVLKQLKKLKKGNE